MKEFEVTLTWRDPNSFQPKSVDKIEGNDLVGLLCQLNIALANLMRAMHEEKLAEVQSGGEYDDIPF